MIPREKRWRAVRPAALAECSADLLCRSAAWSFHISVRATLNGETMGSGNLLPSPLWGRGWLASGVLISRGGKGAPRLACRGGEGVETVNSPHPYRKKRSFARTTGQIDKARELRRSSTEAEQAAWSLLRKLRLKGLRFRRKHPARVIPRFFVKREDFVPRASRPCSSMAGTAMARLWLRLCRAVGPCVADFCRRERRPIVELYGATLIVAPPLRAACRAQARRYLRMRNHLWRSV